MGSTSRQLTAVSSKSSKPSSSLVLIAQNQICKEKKEKIYKNIFGVGKTPFVRRRSSLAYEYPPSSSMQRRIRLYIITSPPYSLSKLTFRLEANGRQAVACLSEWLNSSEARSKEPGVRASTEAVA